MCSGALITNLCFWSFGLHKSHVLVSELVSLAAPTTNTLTITTCIVWKNSLLSKSRVITRLLHTLYKESCCIYWYLFKRVNVIKNTKPLTFYIKQSDSKTINTILKTASVAMLRLFHKIKNYTAGYTVSFIIFLRQRSREGLPAALSKPLETL